MKMCMDYKWKPSEKGSRRSATVTPTTSGSPVGLKGQASRGPARSVPSRLASLVKEQRARFYVMRRCVTLLVCWHY